MFVRTKNNEIIDLSYCRYFEEEHRYWNGADCYSFDECEIIKKAETIEELCDEFVLVAEDYDYFQTTRKITRKWVFDDLADTEQKEEEIGKGISRTIYGAIWAEKGLVFVAKENIKGELELL